MNYKILPIPNFEREAKRLIKKFPFLKLEIRELGFELSKNPKQGDPLGHNCFKIRLSIASKGKGKSGGARVITNIYVDDSSVFLLSIYDKSEKSNLIEKELKQLLKEIGK